MRRLSMFNALALTALVACGGEAPELSEDQADVRGCDAGALASSRTLTAGNTDQVVVRKSACGFPSVLVEAAALTFSARAGGEDLVVVGVEERSDQTRVILRFSHEISHISANHHQATSTAALYKWTDENGHVTYNAVPRNSRLVFEFSSPVDPLSAPAVVLDLVATR